MKKVVGLIFLLPAGWLQAQQPELVLPVGHTATVNTAEFSPDNKYVVTGGADKTVNIWETFSGKKIRTLSGSPSDIRYAFFSPDGKFIAAGTDSSVSIWSVPSYERMSEFNLVRRAYFSLDGKRLFLLGSNGTLTQYSLPSLKKEFAYEDHIVFSWDTGLKITKTAISPDGQWLFTAADSNAILRKTETGDIVARVPFIHTQACFFVPDGSAVVAVTSGGLQKLDIKNGFTVSTLDSNLSTFSGISRNNRFLLLGGKDFMEQNGSLWDLSLQKRVFRSDTVRSVQDTMAVLNDSLEVTGWKTGTAAYGFPGRLINYSNCVISPEGTYLRSGIFLWNNKNNMLSYEIRENILSRADFSRDERYLLTEQEGGVVCLWDIEAKKIVQRYESHADRIDIAEISPDGTRLLLGTGGKSIQLLDLENGVLLQRYSHKGKVANAFFSRDGKQVLTNSFDSTARTWDVNTGSLVKTFRGKNPEANPVYYNASGQLTQTRLVMDTIPEYDPVDPAKIARFRYFPSILYDEVRLQKIIGRTSRSGHYSFEVTPAGFYTIKDSRTGKTLRLPGVSGYDVYEPFVAFSPDDKTMVIGGERWRDTLRVWDIVSSRWLDFVVLDMNPGRYGNKTLRSLKFSADNQYLLAADNNSEVYVLSGHTFKTLFKLQGDHFSISDDSKRMAIVNQGICSIYDMGKRQLLYNFISVDSANYLVLDREQRFDGTEKARNLLYYVCGNEVFDLAQLKDQLWVPGLVERIFQGDSIRNKTLRELQICGIAPRVEYYGEFIKDGEDNYWFNIYPGRGGLGETVLYVNGIEVARYTVRDMAKYDFNDYYLLRVSKYGIEGYFDPNKENPVTVKAYTADNTISSRGAITAVQSEYTLGPQPRLFAVMVGVSDYKGTELDLKYAAKDARDLSKAVEAAAKKLLNHQGSDNVLMYDLSTSAGHYALPEKKSIQSVFESIGRSARANDILLIFFAGHGVMAGNDDQKQFYFLTADASTFSSVDAVKDAGISMSELTEWIKPQRIRAQKRILIFDACNSGQAIRDFIKLGKEDQGYMAARNDDKAQQVKAIDKLNEKSGLFILSASASNQSAYEMGRYSQGLLTYSLLKAIKQQPDILEDGKYLNVSRWFNEAGKTASEISKESGARQEPQIVSNTNFNIGIVDEEVMAKIVLPEEKPLFAASNFQNSDESIADDDLEISKLINLQLSDIASRGAESKIVYVTATNAPDAWSLSGRYEVKGNMVTVKANLKQNREIRQRFEISGTKDKLKELAAKVAERAAGLAK